MRMHHGDGNQQAEGREKGLARVLQRKAHASHVEAVLLQCGLASPGRRAPQNSAERRHEEQREDEAREERGDQRDRQVFHEFADDIGPEHQRGEGGDARDGGGHHGASHPVRGKLVGLARVHAFSHAAFGIFGHDDRIVDQFAHREDEREQHHDVHREARELQPHDPRKERKRHREPDDQRGTEAEGRENDGRDQQHAGDHRILQVAQHGADIHRAVLRGDELDRGRQQRLRALQHHLHGIDRIDEVRTGALRDLDRDGGLAVNAGDARGILEGGAHFGHIAEPHHRARIGENRQLQDILRLFQQARHLHREAALLAFQCARGNERIARPHRADEIIQRHAIGGKKRGLDEDFHHLVARALEFGCQHAWHLLDGRAQLA